MDKDFLLKRKELFCKYLLNHMNMHHRDFANDKVLVVGAAIYDYQILTRAGFKNISVSNLETDLGRGLESLDQDQKLALDVENLDLPDQSYDVVFAYEVLHHCRSPHRGLCEMVRVARK